MLRNKAARVYLRLSQTGQLEIKELPCDATGIYTLDGERLQPTDETVVLWGWPDKSARVHRTITAEWLVP